MIAQRDCDDSDESYDWAIAIEVFLGRIATVMLGRSLRIGENSRRG
jgi:hypothetical protein